MLQGFQTILKSKTSELDLKVEARVRSQRTTGGRECAGAQGPSGAGVKEFREDSRGPTAEGALERKSAEPRVC